VPGAALGPELATVSLPAPRGVSPTSAMLRTSLAKEAGLTHGDFYRHFGCREAHRRGRVAGFTPGWAGLGRAPHAPIPAS
jgi:hypothetical protein